MHPRRIEATLVFVRQTNDESPRDRLLHTPLRVRDFIDCNGLLLRPTGRDQVKIRARITERGDIHSSRSRARMSPDGTRKELDPSRPPTEVSIETRERRAVGSLEPWMRTRLPLRHLMTGSRKCLACRR